MEVGQWSMVVRWALHGCCKVSSVCYMGATCVLVVSVFYIAVVWVLTMEGLIDVL